MPGASAGASKGKRGGKGCIWICICIYVVVSVFASMFVSVFVLSGASQHTGEKRWQALQGVGNVHFFINAMFSLHLFFLIDI